MSFRSARAFILLTLLALVLAAAGGVRAWGGAHPAPQGTEVVICGADGPRTVRLAADGTLATEDGGTCCTDGPCADCTVPGRAAVPPAAPGLPVALTPALASRPAAPLAERPRRPRPPQHPRGPPTRT